VIVLFPGLAAVGRRKRNLKLFPVKANAHVLSLHGLLLCCRFVSIKVLYVEKVDKIIDQTHITISDPLPST
jgi:hypothetical protein